MTIKEERTERAVKYGYTAFENTFNCGQSSLAGLLDEFKEDLKLGDVEREALIKANGATWGLGGHGLTCGTAQGPIHFIGVVYGEDYTREKFNPMKIGAQFSKVGGLIYEYEKKFIERWGSTNCKDVHKACVGDYYDLSKEAERGRFMGDGARDKCQAAIEFAIRTACEMLMNDDGTLKD